MKGLRKLRYLIWFILPVLFWWALRDVPFADIMTALRGLRPSRLFILVAFNLVIMLLFSSRWWLILRAQGYRLSYLSLVGYRLAGFAISYFTPGTQFGGEPLQVYLLEKQQGVSRAIAISSVALDKLFELLANFTFLAIGILVVLGGGLIPGLAHIHAVVWIAVLLGSSVTYLLCLATGRAPLSWLLGGVLKRVHGLNLLRKILPSVASSEAKVSTLFKRKPLTILSILAISGVIWLLLIVEYGLTMHFLGASFNLTQTISALTAARLAFLTPSPGGLGALEVSQVFAMQALGLHPALGISISLLIRARDVSLGLVGLWLGAILTRYRQTCPSSSQAGESL